MDTYYDLLNLIMENPPIECLIRFESGGNINAIGDNGKAIGILQFHQATFDLFSERYGLELDIYSPKDQILLASKMLQEDSNNIYHWSVWRNCI